MKSTLKLLGEERDAGARAADDDLNNRLFFRMFQAQNIYERQAQREVGYSAVQGAVLGALSRAPQGGITFSELVEHLAVSRQNLDGVLKRLEKLDCVERVEDPENRRIKRVRLTPAGQRAWDALLVDALRFYRAATHGISYTDKVVFLETLVRIGRGLRAIGQGSVAQDGDADSRLASRGRASAKQAVAKVATGRPAMQPKAKPATATLRKQTARPGSKLAAGRGAKRVR